MRDREKKNNSRTRLSERERETGEFKERKRRGVEEKECHGGVCVWERMSRCVFIV